MLLLSAKGNDDYRKVDDDDKEGDGGVLPLFTEGEQLHKSFVSRLEAIYDLDPVGSDFNSAPQSSATSQRLLEEGERVVLGDWMDWEDGRCTGDSCGDEFDVSRKWL